ncbi:MAG: hypothetical protein JWP03_3556 [Phycisphaerales bacterium]|nr:hypothetical protein [Phycisphaerales bacterium]
MKLTGAGRDVGEGFQTGFLPITTPRVPPHPATVVIGPKPVIMVGDDEKAPSIEIRAPKKPPPSFD